MWTNIGGTLYKKGAIVVIKNELLPKFGQILDILVHDVIHSVFVCENYVTCFNTHFHCFEVVRSTPISVTFCKQSDLADYYVYSCYSLSSHPNSMFVSCKYHLIENIKI